MQFNFENLNFLLILFIIWLILQSVIIIFILKIRKKFNEILELKKELSKINKEKIKIDNAIKLKEFLYDFIEDKFKYRLYKDILPFYIKNKKLDKNQIQELKENIYLEVKISLSKPLKQELLIYFTKDGLDLMIHEYILNLLNKIDLKFFDQNEVELDNVKII